MHQIDQPLSYLPAPEVSEKDAREQAVRRSRSTATSTPAPVTAWQGAYFNNTTFSGSPAMTRDDGDTLNFYWSGSPGPGVNADDFSVRWTRALAFDTGTYQFTFTHDDGGRILVDGQAITQQWVLQVPTASTMNYGVSGGTHTVTVEYFTTWGDAVVSLSIARVDNGSTPAATFTAAPAPTLTPTRTATAAPTDTAAVSPTRTPTTVPTNTAAASPTRTPTTVPTNTPTPSPVPTQSTPPAASDWLGLYFNNTTLAAPGILARDDGQLLDFTWPDSPAPGVVPDYFSVRWGQTLTTNAGMYRFALTHDDGARLYVDGALVLDHWYTQVPTTYAADVYLAAGQHALKLEYYHTWGGAVVGLGVQQTSGAPTATPTAAPLIPTPTPTPTQGGPTPTRTPTANAPTSTPTRTPTPPATSTPLPATPTVAATPLAGTRDKYAWPCASTSIWNMPIGSGAVYVPAGIQPANGWGGAITTDDEIIDLNPNDPLKPLNGGPLVHVAPWMEHDGSWNGVAAFLGADGNSVQQGQPLVLSAGGNPSWDYWYPTVDIRGDCIAGAHGGSGLSSFGGSIRKGELSSAQPLRHALKVNLYAKRFLSQAGGGYRWPASQADSYALTGGGCPAYGGPVAALRMGSLLALPPNTDLSWIQSPRARKIAQALMDYGAYVVDDTCWDVHAVDIEAGAEFSDGGTFDADLQRVFTLLAVVDNNGPGSIGGGGTPRVPLAPPIGN